MGQASPPPSTKHTPAAPRVQPATDNDDRRSTPPMTERMQPVPRVRTQAGQRAQHPPMHHPAITTMPSAKAIKKRKRRKAAAKLAVSPTNPVCNTRSRTKPAEPAVTRTKRTATEIGLAAASPAPRASASAPKNKTNTRNKKSRLTQPTVSSRIKTKIGHSEAVEAHNRRQIMRQMTKKVTKIENEVHQEMAVMDAEIGKVLNYRQLRRDLKYSKEWENLQRMNLDVLPTA